MSIPGVYARQYAYNYRQLAYAGQSQTVYPAQQKVVYPAQQQYVYPSQYPQNYNYYYPAAYQPAYNAYYPVYHQHSNACYCPSCGTPVYIIPGDTKNSYNGIGAIAIATLILIALDILFLRHR